MTGQQNRVVTFPDGSKVQVTCTPPPKPRSIGHEWTGEHDAWRCSCGAVCDHHVPCPHHGICPLLCRYCKTPLAPEEDEQHNHGICSACWSEAAAEAAGQ